MSKSSIRDPGNCIYNGCLAFRFKAYRHVVLFSWACDPINLHTWFHDTWDGKIVVRSDSKPFCESFPMILYVLRPNKYKCCLVQISKYWLIPYTQKVWEIKKIFWSELCTKYTFTESAQNIMLKHRLKNYHLSSESKEAPFKMDYLQPYLIHCHYNNLLL